jgi:hypothetical protein
MLFSRFHSRLDCFRLRYFFIQIDFYFVANYSRGFNWKGERLFGRHRRGYCMAGKSARRANLIASFLFFLALMRAVKSKVQMSE